MLGYIGLTAMADDFQILNAQLFILQAAVAGLGSGLSHEIGNANRIKIRLGFTGGEQ